MSKVLQMEEEDDIIMAKKAKIVSEKKGDRLKAKRSRGKKTETDELEEQIEDVELDENEDEDEDEEEKARITGTCLYNLLLGS